MIPLYGFLQGDTIGLLVLAEESDTAQVLAAKLESAASVRVAPKGSPRVIFEGRVLSQKETLARAGMKPLDRFDVIG